MVVALVIAFFVLLIAVPVVVEMRDALVHGRHGARGATDDGALPLLIFPVPAREAPVEPAHPWNVPAVPAAARSPEPEAVPPVSVAPPPSAPPSAPPRTTTPTPRNRNRSGESRSETHAHDVEAHNFSHVAQPSAAQQDARAQSAKAQDAGATVVFRRPTDEPVQILPGRFKVIAGEKGRDEIRFVGSLGEPAQIVVGREVGPPQRVVTLNSPTVSRQHARMDFANGHWTISNLSATNPVLVNNERLSSSGGSRPLADGDQIELGEVILRFHSR